PGKPDLQGAAVSRGQLRDAGAPSRRARAGAGVRRETRSRSRHRVHGRMRRICFRIFGHRRGRQSVGEITRGEIVMRRWFISSMVTVAIVSAVVGAMISVSVTRTSGQAARPARTADGKPNFSGIWQALNEANWDLQAHEARAGAVMQQGVYSYDYARVPAAPVLALGAAGGCPGSTGVVQGDGQIPYTPEAAKIRQENAEHWIDRDPELKCYLPGVPRAMYMPYPFEIVQSTNKIQMAYEFTSTA